MWIPVVGLNYNMSLGCGVFDSQGLELVVAFWCLVGEYGVELEVV